MSGICRNRSSCITNKPCRPLRSCSEAGWIKSTQSGPTCPAHLNIHARSLQCLCCRCFKLRNGCASWELAVQSLHSAGTRSGIAYICVCIFICIHTQMYTYMQVHRAEPTEWEAMHAASIYVLFYSSAPPFRNGNINCTFNLFQLLVSTLIGTQAR